MKMHLEIYTRAGRTIIGASDEVTEESREKLMEYFRGVMKDEKKGYLTLETDDGNEIIITMSAIDYIKFVKDF